MTDVKCLKAPAEAAVIISSVGLCVFILTWWIDLILAVAEPGPFDFVSFVPHIHEVFEPLHVVSFALAEIILLGFLIAMVYGCVSVALGKR
ncbi:MAG: hypothetical protein IB616_00015 [Methanosarcinales archaeon]|nr:MAG: hypothetical protein IB616_00015 [Methanosarcinales archaeon]